MQANSSTTTTTTTTKTKKLSSGTGTNMISSVAVTSAIKTTTTTRKPAGSGVSSKVSKAQGATNSTPASSDSNAEIAELTKKINDHADAIYHTWKSQGIPPTELLTMYTSAAASGDLADVASPTADAEGLQKMVTCFVNKDKEQRGKSNTLKKSDITTANGKVKKAAVSSFSPVPDQALQSPKKVAAVTVSKPLPDVNLNYDISLDLDVNNLSSQQTQNLLKISELIQQQKDVAATVGKKRQNSKANSSSSINSNHIGNSASSNKLTASEQPTKKQSKANSSGSTRTGSAAVSLDVVDGPSAARIANSTAVSDKGGEPAATGSRKSSKTKETSADSKPATKEKPTAVATVANARKSTSRIATDNAGNMAAATAAASATSATSAATATSMDATPATAASTTMPTLNKVKPTSGTRAALANGQDKSNTLDMNPIYSNALAIQISVSTSSESPHPWLRGRARAHVRKVSGCAARLPQHQTAPDGSSAQESHEGEL